MDQMIMWCLFWAFAAYVRCLYRARYIAKGLPDEVYLPTAPRFYALMGALVVGASVLLGGACLSTLRPAYAQSMQGDDWALWSLVFALCGYALTQGLVRAQVHARRFLEGIGVFVFALAALVAVVVTGAIVFLLVKEAARFFAFVPLGTFMTGDTWAPEISLSASQSATGAYGALPLFTGSLLITVIALFVGGPIGLMVAIFTSQYASAQTRLWLKPMIEILAGIPTIVYGFFALAVVSPALYNLGELLGVPISGESALGAGLVMGLMILPVVSSLGDDALRAVPKSFFENSLALGATRSETIQKVLLPAAMPGLISAFLLAISRAIGETMLVLMAVGLQANLTANPLNYVTTVTVQIVTILTGDQEFDSAKTLSAFALALLLFLVTLILNVVALSVAAWHYKRYDR